MIVASKVSSHSSGLHFAYRLKPLSFAAALSYRRTRTLFSKLTQQRNMISAVHFFPHYLIFVLDSAQKRTEGDYQFVRAQMLYENTAH